MTNHDADNRRRRQRRQPVTSPVVPLVPAARSSTPTRTSDTLTTLDAVLVAQRRIALELVQIGGVAAAEPLRALGEFQSAAVDSAWLSRDLGAIGASRDPFQWAGWGVVSAVEATGRMLGLVATASAIIARSAGRINGTLARSGESIQEAVSARGSRVAASPFGR